MDAELSVVIPAYNEGGNIAPLYREVKDVLKGLHRPYEILFVDDGSHDRTFHEMKVLRQQDPLVRVIRFKKNFGQSAALQAGFDHAQGALVITLDADLQNDPHDIPALVEKLEKDELDVVCGWRYNRHDKASKKLFSKLANRLRKTLTGETIHDSGCTLRVYRAECVKDLELYGELHRYIPAILQWKGYIIGELPVNHRERRSGTTKYNCSRLFKGFLDLIVVTFWQKYSARPMHIFGGSGLLLGFAGVVISGILIFERLLYGSGLTDRPLFLLGIVLVIIGIQFVAIGILADILIKIYYGQKGRKNYLIETKSKND
jgi:glycosyltransferase involved in cell wall biosynthesis